MVIPLGIGFTFMMGLHIYNVRKIDRFYEEQNRRIDTLAVKVDKLTEDIRRILVQLK